MNRKETLEFLIKDEISAIDGYDKGMEDDPKDKGLFKEISDEKRHHIRELFVAYLNEMGFLEAKR